MNEMRSRTLALSLATHLLSVSAATTAWAEPPWQVPYVNPRTGECGLFRDGFRNQERTPLDPGFGQLRLPSQPVACERLLDKVLAYPEPRALPRELRAEAATKPPCERLALSLPASVEHTCKALGYRYVGELPASTRPCYPNLAPFLGARCAPLIWIHLALLIAIAASLGALGYTIFRRRAQRRRALAASDE